jgi:hypothetical protein
MAPWKLNRGRLLVFPEDGGGGEPVRVEGGAAVGVFESSQESSERGEMAAMDKDYDEEGVDDDDEAEPDVGHAYEEEFMEEMWDYDVNSEHDDREGIGSDDSLFGDEDAFPDEFAVST